MISAKAESVTSILAQRSAVARSMGDAKTKDSLKQVVKPNSISKTLRRTGLALVLAPDPITAVPGAVLIGASIATRKRDALNAASVAEETRKILDEMGRLI
jgi:hypothetical protein